jgi:subtilase family serine protease
MTEGINGAGKTIVIIDAYGSPTIASDLHDFDVEFSLPDPNFSIIDPAGNPPAFNINDNNVVGWGEETSLDVQWAHAMAPGANIVLAVAPSNNDSDILAVTKYVVDHKVGDVVSQSFGEAESCVDPSLLSQEQAIFQKGVDEGITFFASSGDSGASQFNCAGTAAILSASSPASDPNVTGVGGTTLLADSNTGAYDSETAWTETAFGCNPPAVALDDINCSGGGFSTIYGRPSWQRSQVKGGEPHPGRGVPDVAYNAGSSGGVLTHIGFVLSGFFGLPPDTQAYFAIGGTSAGSPQWAGLAAGAAQIAGHDLGNINQSLYQFGQAQKAYAADFHDITTGNNDVSELTGVQGYDTSTGWDPVTGLGTPNAGNLLPALAKKN